MFYYSFKNVFGVQLDAPQVTTLVAAKRVAKELAVKFRTTISVHKCGYYVGCVEFPSWYRSIPNLSVNDFIFYSFCKVSK